MSIAVNYLSVKEAAHVLGVGQATVYEWVSSGYLPALRIGRGRIRIQPSALEALIQPTGRAA